MQTACRIKDERDQMGFGVVVLSGSAFGVCARGVEILQGNGLKTLGTHAGFQDRLDHGFTVAVWVDRYNGQVF